MEIEHSAFEAALKLVDRIPTRNGILPSQYIRIKPTKTGDIELTLTAEATAKATVKGTGVWPMGSVYVDRKHLSAFVSNVVRGALKFSRDGESDTLVLKNGRRTIKLPSSSGVNGYAKTPSAKTVTELRLSPEQFHTLSLARGFATTDLAYPALNCVYIDAKGHVYATDSKRIFISEIKAPKRVIAIPLFLAALLDSATKVEIGDKLALATFNEGVIFQTSADDPLSKFPVAAIRQRVVDGGKYPIVARASANKVALHLKNMTPHANAQKRTRCTLEVTTSKKGNKGTVKLRIHADNHIVTESFAADVQREVAFRIPFEDAAHCVGMLADGKSDLEVRFDVDAPAVLFGSGKDMQVFLATMAEDTATN